MASEILKYIHSEKENGKKLLAILVDPDKLKLREIKKTVLKINNTKVDFIFVGGSTVLPNATHLFVQELKIHTKIPVVLFPGETGQITDLADGILFLSLLSGDNPEYLIHQQVKAAPILKKTNLEIIPTGYILVDGGNKTAVQKISETTPILQSEKNKIINTALAAEYLGKQLVYLEAGSGAKKPIAPSIISAVRKEIDIPIIVGGGIRSHAAMQNAYDNGADIVVIGTAFEENENFLQNF